MAFSSQPTGAPPAGRPLLLCGAHLTDGRVVDVRLADERVEAVGMPGSLADAEHVDLSDHLLLPAPAEPHAHLDVAGTAHGPPPVDECADDALRRTLRAALTYLGHGATALRTHVRVDPPHGLAGLRVAVRARELLRDLAALQVVAVPRALTGVSAGVDGRALLREALRSGADVVGGCPDLDPDPAGHLELVLRLADEFGCPADLHTDAEDPTRLTRLAGLAGGLRGSVAMGPCGGLVAPEPQTTTVTVPRLAASGVRIVCLPQGGCELSRHGPSPLSALRAGGVSYAAGGGALHDPANPVGRGDPLHSAYLMAISGPLRAQEAYAAVSDTARAAMGLPDVRVEPGFPADLLAVRARTMEEALAGAGARVVVRRGRLVSRVSMVREFPDALSAHLPRQSRAPGRDTGADAGPDDDSRP